METISHNPGKSTTSGSPSARFCAPARAAAVAALAMLIALGVGCSTARRRSEPTNLVANLRFHDAATERRFARSYRSASLYEDFRTVLLADAIAMDPSYRRGFVQMVSKSYLLSDADAQAMEREQQAEFASNMSLLVFLYGGNNRPIPLGQAESPWRVLLQDDDGQILAPAAIERLRPDSPTYRYLSMYFDGLDRWSQAFKISFPKMDKVTLGLPTGKQPITLIVTGLAGTARMVWSDPSVFYGAPAPAAQPPTALLPAAPVPEGAQPGGAKP